MSKIAKLVEVGRAGAAVPVKGLTTRRRALALTIAGAADVAQLAFAPVFAEGAASPFEDALDAAVAIALVAVCGFSWRMALAFIAELVPGVSLFPTWTTLVLSLPSAAPQADAPVVPEPEPARGTR